MSALRHRWIRPSKEYGASTAICAHCGVERVRRHAYNYHWTEFWRDGKALPLKAGAIPECIVAVSDQRGSAE